MATGKKIGKVAVVAGVCDGFIGNRMLKPRQMEAMKLLLEGATPAQVDKVHVEFGMPMGPFQMSDLAGVRSEEHTSELQSLMRISYAVFCLKKKKTKIIRRDRCTTHKISNS